MPHIDYQVTFNSDQFGYALDRWPRDDEADQLADAVCDFLHDVVPLIAVALDGYAHRATTAKKLALRESYADEPKQYDVEDRQRCPSCGADVSSLPASDIEDCDHNLQVFQTCPCCGAKLAWQYYVTACDVWRA